MFVCGRSHQSLHFYIFFQVFRLKQQYFTVRCDVLSVVLVKPVRACVCFSVDPYGFERSGDFDYESYEELMSEYLAVLTRRSIKWSKLLQGKPRVDRNLKGKCHTKRTRVTQAYRAVL